MSTPGREPTDWESVERDYRTTNLSMAVIASRYGVTRQSVSRKVKQKGWVRDLRSKVRARASQIVISGDAVNQTEQQLVERAAEDAAGVLKRHRTHLADWGDVVDKMRRALADIEFDEDNIGRMALTVKQCVDAQLSLIKAERTAFALDDDDSRRGDTLEQKLAQMLEEGSA